MNFNRKSEKRSRVPSIWHSVNVVSSSVSLSVSAQGATQLTELTGDAAQGRHVFPMNCDKGPICIISIGAMLGFVRSLPPESKARCHPSERSCATRTYDN